VSTTSGSPCTGWCTSPADHAHRRPAIR
jgi:hypothetical protein